MTQKGPHYQGAVVLIFINCMAWLSRDCPGLTCDTHSHTQVSVQNSGPMVLYDMKIKHCSDRIVLFSGGHFHLDPISQQDPIYLRANVSIYREELYRTIDLLSLGQKIIFSNFALWL